MKSAVIAVGSSAMEVPQSVNPNPGRGLGEYQAAPMVSAPAAPTAVVPLVGSMSAPMTRHGARFRGWPMLQLLLPLIIYNLPSKHGWFECKRPLDAEPCHIPQRHPQGRSGEQCLVLGTQFENCVNSSRIAS